MMSGSRAVTRSAWCLAGLAALGLSVAPVDDCSADAALPEVGIESPALDATVYGGISVSASASDDTGVVGVQFLLNGAALGAEDLAAPYAVPWNTGLASNGSHTLTARARDAAGNARTSVPITVTVLNDGSPQQIGEWAPRMTWPLVGIHMTLLTTSELLLWDDWGFDGVAWLWNPSTNAFTQIPTHSGPFCAANTLMPDGRVLIVGGHPHDEDAEHEHDHVRGLKETNIFDAITRVWSRHADLRFRRWYSTTVPLSNGQVVGISGQITTTTWADTPELYDPATDAWKILPMANTSDAHTVQYLRSHLLADGTIFVFTPEDGKLHRFNVGAQQWLTEGAAPILHGSAVLYRPQRVLICGGGTQDLPSQMTSVLVDLTQAAWTTRTISPMRFRRYNHTLVLLPGGQVMAVGGSTTVSSEALAGTLEAESWDPVTEAWTTLDATQDPRMYHSTALLLPDGRVLAAGGGRAGVANDYFSAEIFSPPYLFRGPRPVITEAPSDLQYGEPFTVESPDAAAVASVALIPLGSVTHTINSNQRYLELSFVRSGTTLTVQSLTDPDVLTPGYYMLFLINAEGVPSVASIVRYPIPPQLPPPAGVEAFREVSGQVVMEAEHYDERIDRGGRTWEPDVDQAGYSRTAYLRALPNLGATIQSNYTTVSPELIYRVWFTTPGTYYLWIRGHEDSGDDDSVHAGVDGAGPSTADRISSFISATWVWKQTTMDGPVATVVIPSAGLHTIHLWMREDGVRIDKLLLRRSSSTTPPSGLGAPESVRILVGGGDAVPPLISAIGASNVTQSGATIAWTTDEPSTTQVEYGSTSAYGKASVFDPTLAAGHSAALSALTPGTLYHYRVRSTDGAGNEAVSDDQTFTTASAAGSAFQEAGGQVVMEAERFDAKVVRSGHDWTLLATQPGFSGSGYMSSQPNTGHAISSGYVTTSPELRFNVNFTTTGTYYLWLRGAADTGSDDSAHAGVDGTGPSAADKLNGFTSATWVWKQTTMDGPVATLSIPTPGLHTVHFWMREDGLRIDKILLRKSSSSTAPAGAGPAESPRG